MAGIDRFQRQTRADEGDDARGVLLHAGALQTAGDVREHVGEWGVDPLLAAADADLIDPAGLGVDQAEPAAVAEDAVARGAAGGGQLTDLAVLHGGIDAAAGAAAGADGLGELLGQAALPVGSASNRAPVGQTARHVPQEMQEDSP